MARKENQPLIDQIDSAIDQMNIEIPNWRSDLYKEYYGAQALNTELSAGEQVLLEKLRSENAVIRAALAPDSAPYSYYENGEYKGITAEIFQATTTASCAQITVSEYQRSSWRTSRRSTSAPRTAAPQRYRVPGWECPS